MKASTKRKIRKILSPVRRVGLKNRNFTIISNNCWGGFVYDYFGLQYLTPTIGLFFYAEDYIKFLKKINYYLSIECKPLNIEDSKYRVKNIENNHTMLGVIDDVEIVFVHYDSVEEGVEKWNKRRKRVNFDNILIKNNDQNMFNEQYLEEYNKLNYKYKIFFTGNSKFQHIENVIYFSDNDGASITNDIKTSTKYINFKQMLNKMIKVDKNE